MFKKLVPFVIMLLIAVFVYREGIFSSETVLTSHDYNTSSVVWRQMGSEGSTAGGVWYRDYMAGWADQVLPYNVFWLTIKAFDPFTSLTMVYFLGTLLTGWFFYLFMRSTGVSVLGSLFGGVSLMLSNHFLTVLLPGHASKFMTFLWIPLVFLFLRKAVRDNRWTHYLYAGFFLGLSLQGQFYEAVLFFILLAAAYWLYLVLNKRETGIAFLAYIRTRVREILLHKLGFVIMIGLMLIMSLQLFPTMMNLATKTTAQQQDSGQKWDFATSWSLPPEEILDLVVPGVFGWKSGDEKMPYWGRMGKPSVASGLKLNNENVGMIVAILGLLACVILRKERGSEAGFWLGAVIATLIFALGRHLPILYGPFYHLPFMDSIRNPNKILWLTMFAVSVLGAKGFHLLFEKTLREKYRAGIEKFGRGLRVAVFVLGGLTILSLIVGPELRSLIVERTRNAAGAGHVIGYMPLAFLLATVFAAALWLMIRRLSNTKDSQRTLLIFACLIIFLAGFDLWLSGRHFVSYTPRETTLDYTGTPGVIVKNGQLAGIGYHAGKPDPVVSWLKQQTANGAGRVFVQLNQITDMYSRHLFPYYGIPCINFNPNPRLPLEYADFMQATGYHPYQYAPLAGTYLSVRYVLSLEQMQKTNLPGSIAASFHLTTWPEGQPTGLVYRIYEVTNSLPQAWIAYAVRESASSEAAMRALQTTNQRALLAPVVEKGRLPALAAFSSETALSLKTNAVCRFVTYGQTALEISVETKAPGLLVVNDAWHAGWTATVNGTPAPIHPVNILFRGVEVPAGASTVRMEYRPWPTLHAASLAGYGLILVVAVGEWFVRRKRRSDGTNP